MRGAEGGAVEDAGLGAVDYQCVEGHLAQDFVHGAFADEVFFEGIRETVERGAEEGEEVTF